MSFLSLLKRATWLFQFLSHIKDKKATTMSRRLHVCMKWNLTHCRSRINGLSGVVRAYRVPKVKISAYTEAWVVFTFKMVFVCNISIYISHYLLDFGQFSYVTVRKLVVIIIIQLHTSVLHMCQDVVGNIRITLMKCEKQNNQRSQPFSLDTDVYTGRSRLHAAQRGYDLTLRFNRLLSPSHSSYSFIPSVPLQFPPPTSTLSTRPACLTAAKG